MGVKGTIKTSVLLLVCMLYIRRGLGPHVVIESGWRPAGLVKSADLPTISEPEDKRKFKFTGKKIKIHG